MKFGESSNPALNKRVFERAFADSVAETMTVRGAIHKTVLLAMLALLTATYVWRWLMSGADPATVMPVMIAGAIGGLVFALITTFKLEWSAFTTPVYALCEGLFLGGISAIFERMIPGIAIQAIGLTFGVLFLMLFLYRTGVIRATEKLKMGIVAATGAVALFYIVSMIANLFGANISVFNMGLVGVGIQFLIVGIAAFNLILNFNFIEEGEYRNAPKYIEWYSAFSLLVTIVWLYVEILKLLAVLARRN